MPKALSPLRAVPLLAAAALVLHELRYAIAPSVHADEAGHAYLALTAPVVAALLAGAVAGFAVSLARRDVARADDPAGFTRLWISATAVLAATYAVQEVLEGTLAAGHPAGIGALVAHGGWIGFALAPIVGAIVALLLRGARALLVLVSWTQRRPRARPPRARRPATGPLPGLDPMARHLAGRGPPLASSSG